MREQIANLTISIPYKRAGNVIMQEPVDFVLYRTTEYFELIPCLSDEEIRIANLPMQLQFIMEDGKPVSLRGTRDGNFHVINDAVQQLKEQNHFL